VIGQLTQYIKQKSRIEKMKFTYDIKTKSATYTYQKYVYTNEQKFRNTIGF